MTNRGTRAPVVIDPTDPRAVAICDGCGFITMHDSLRERREFRGGLTPQGTGLWVCAVCDDVPQPYFQKMVLRPDPVPVMNPRTQSFTGDPTPILFLVSEDGTYVTDFNAQNYVIGQVGQS